MMSLKLMRFIATTYTKFNIMNQITSKPIIPGQYKTFTEEVHGVEREITVYYGFTKGLKSNDRDVPDDPDEYEILSVYETHGSDIHEVETSQEFDDMLIEKLGE